MRKIKNGDIYEITLEDRYGYFQCIEENNKMGDFVRVFSSNERLSSDYLLELIKVNDYFMVRIPIKYARRNSKISFIKNLPIEGEFSKPLFMRSKHVSVNDGSGWQIININNYKRNFVKVLSEEQKKLSPFGIINDLKLIEWLESNWNLNNWK